MGRRHRLRLKRGVTIPLEDARGIRAGLSLIADDHMTDEEFTDMWANQQVQLLLMAEIYHAFTDRRGLAEQHYSLTPAELDALQYAARGLTQKQIARVLGKRPPTIGNQLKSARERLRTKNLIQAITKAVALGLIEL